VTAPGPGDAPLIKTFRWDLYKPTARAQANGTTPQGHSSKPSDPKQTAQFMAYDEGYTGGVALSTGWVAGAEGGAKSIVTSQLGAEGTVKVWSTGSLLDGQPSVYLESPNHHEQNIKYNQIASFAPFPGSGAMVATTSTTVGADLLVSGKGPGGSEVRKFNLARAGAEAKELTPKMIATLPMPGSNGSGPLGGR
jgi:hypothetical protein